MKENKEKKSWLLSVLKGELDQEDLVKGYLKYYALPEKPLGDMLVDFVFQLECNPNIAGIMVENVKKKIQDYVGEMEE